MPTLSIYIMAQNEENRIRNALASVQGLGDELVVIDGGSTDRTPELSREYGARVITHPFEGYARQRAFALTQLTGDWVFAIDADETLSPELREAIPGLISHGSADAYEFSRRNYVKPGVWLEYAGMYPDYQRRLFRRTQARYGESVHTGEVPVVPGPVQQINLDIIHNQIGNNIQYSFTKLWNFITSEVRETTKTRSPVYYVFTGFLHFFVVLMKKLFLQRGYKMKSLGIRVAFSHAVLRFCVNVGLAFKSSGAG